MYGVTYNMKNSKKHDFDSNDTDINKVLGEIEKGLKGKYVKLVGKRGIVMIKVSEISSIEIYEV